LQKPNCKLTPGCIAPKHQKRQKDEAKIFKEYGILPADQSKYTIDHLIPLELDGANCPENLWPQPSAEAHLKDQDENTLGKQVKSRELTMTQAQQSMASKWGCGWAAVIKK
jgi:hypothetical protein